MNQKLEDYSREELLTLIKSLKSRKKFGLVWEDKPELVATLCYEKLPVLIEDKSRLIETDSASPTHLMIEGDNYHTLSVLNYTHAGLIDLIYIDPPYNTGTNDFIYNDNYVDKEDTYRHSKWLSFMEKRLQLAKTLLTDEGAVFVSIDDNEYARLVLLMEEIFGEKNVKTIAVKMSEATGVKMSSVASSGRIPKLKEYLVLAKKDGIRNLHIDKLPKEAWDEEYKTLISNATQDEVDEVKAIRDNEERSDKDIERLDSITKNWRTESLSAYFQANPMSKKEQQDFKYQNAWRIVQIATLTGGARNIAISKKSTFPDSSGFFAITTPQKKCYLISGNFSEETELSRCKVLIADDYLTVHPGDFWSDIKTTGLDNEGGVAFKNGKKPLKLIERILKTNTNKDITILDFFAGSGTTGEAVLRLNQKDGGNRKVILATYNEEPGGGSGIIDDACYPRIANHLLGRNGRDKLPGNLRFFKTDFVDKGKTDDQTRIDLVSRCEEIISIRESTFTEIHREGNFVVFGGAQRISVIVYETDAIQSCVEFLNKLETEMPVSIYVFSLSNDPYQSEFSELTKSHELRPIPEGILAVYRRIFDSRIKSLGN